MTTPRFNTADTKPANGHVPQPVPFNPQSHYVPNIDINVIIPALSFKLLFIYGQQLKLYSINSSSSQFRKLFSRIFPAKLLHKLLVSPAQAKYFITLTTANDL
jgi:hypothetical protein